MAVRFLRALAVGVLLLFPATSQAQFSLDKIIKGIEKKVEDTLKEPGPADDGGGTEGPQENRTPPQAAPDNPETVRDAAPSGSAPSRGESPDQPRYDKAWVTEIQWRLTSLGYQPGPIDGAFGNKTRVAIFNFQQKRKLAITGEPTPSLMEALRAASSQASQPEPQQSADTPRQAEMRPETRQPAPQSPRAERDASAPQPTRQPPSAPSRELPAERAAAQPAAAQGAGAEPTCGGILSWARSTDMDATYQPLPNITLSRLFEDRFFTPVFGRSALSWTRDDFNGLQRFIAGCRKEAAAARNQKASNLHYATLKTTQNATRALKTKWSAQYAAQRTMESILKLRLDPAYLPVFAIAEKALKGGDVSGDMANLDRSIYGYATNAAALSDYHLYLDEAEIADYLAQLGERRAALETKQEAGDEELARLLREISSVPVSQAGLNQLRRLHYRTDTTSMTRENVEAYNQAYQARWRFISSEIERGQAQAKHALATNPAPVAGQLGSVVAGDLGPAMTVAGVRTGMPLARAASALNSRMGYKEAISLGHGKQYTVTRKEFARYTEREGRDGGLVNLRTRRGIVGEIEYIEHFTGPIDGAATKQAVVERLGEPDETNRRGSFTEMVWADDGHRLKVILGPRINGVARYFGEWRSSAQFVLQSDEFVEYLEAAAARCARLRDKPTSELSVNDKQAILTGCLTP
jgi:peptidoglycan hydrolase-like protein with peptidoglycan-binding domain